MAWYKTGTVAVTNASTTVTGTGTNFVSGAQVGDGFLGPNELLYEITAINSATSLTIAPAYGGATASSQSYAIAPTQGLVATLASDVTDLITDYQSVVDNAGAGKFGDGSAASPAIRFTNDQDTGFFRDTANEIAFATAGVKRGEFTSSGIQMLDGQKFIAGTGSDLSIFHNGTSSLIEDSGTGGLTIRSNLLTVQNAAGNETVAQFVEDGFVKLFHNNSQVFTTISSGASITGSLGIGISSPAYPLVVQAANPRLQLLGTGTNTGISGLLFGDADTATRGQINYNHPSDSLDIVVNGVERMRIDSNGQVGIGTSSPAAELHVNSGASNLAGLFESTDAGATITLIDNGTTGGSAAEHGLNTVGNQLEIRAVDNLSFETNGAEHIRIVSTGNVGIGHATPDSLLHLKETDSTAYSATATDGQVGVGPTIYLENPANSNTTVGGQIVFGMRSTEEQARIGATGGTAPALTFGTGDAEAMRISGGKVGIGTSSIASDATLHVDGTDTTLLITEDSEGTATLRLGDTQGDVSQSFAIKYDTGTKFANFVLDGTHRAMFNTGGDYVVGPTTAASPFTIYNANNDSTKAGIGLRYSGYIAAARYNDFVMQLNRMNSNGDILGFRKNGSTVGSIGTSGGNLTINSEGAGGYGRLQTQGVDRFVWYQGGFYPAIDNFYDLGVASSGRWNDAYITNGVTTGSDGNDKQDIRDLTEAEQRVAVACKGLLKAWRWKSAVEEKGDDARIHCGIIAQDLQAAFVAEGLDAGRYAMFMSNTWWEHDVEVPAVEAVAEVLDEDGNVVTEAVEAVDAYTRTDTYDTQEEAPEGATERTRLGVRYSELLAFIIGAI